MIATLLEFILILLGTCSRSASGLICRTAVEGDLHWWLLVAFMQQDPHCIGSTVYLTCS